MIVIADDFAEVILQHLQLKLNAGAAPKVKWWDLWFEVAAKSDKFTSPIDAATQRKKFTARLMKAIDLLERIEYLEVNRSPSGRIISLKLRERGIEKVRRDQFIN